MTKKEFDALPLVDLDDPEWKRCSRINPTVRKKKESKPDNTPLLSDDQVPVQTRTHQMRTDGEFEPEDYKPTDEQVAIQKENAEKLIFSVVAEITLDPFGEDTDVMENEENDSPTTPKTIELIRHKTKYTDKELVEEQHATVA